jgi:glycosyltransferase involved in cell wall biosynthesis
MNDLISIIMSAYNDEKFIAESISSVLRQRYKNWELIVINDASTDKTYKILNDFAKKDKRIKHYFNKKNKGLVHNLLNGIKLAKGNYIARLDSDDVWTDKRKLEKQYRFLSKHPDYSLVGCLGNTTNELGGVMFKINHPTKDGDIRKRILIKNCFIHSSILFTKDVYSKVGGYNSNLKFFEDYDLWLKIGTVSKFHNLPEKMVNLRIHQNSMTDKNQSTQIETVFSLIKKYKKVYPNYNFGLIRWGLRKYYLPLLSINTINKIKNIYGSKI